MLSRCPPKGHPHWRVAMAGNADETTKWGGEGEKNIVVPPALHR